MPSVFVVDPGLVHLGWIKVVDGKVTESGNDTVYHDEKPVRQALTENTVGWLKAHEKIIRSCDVVIVELQFHAKGNYGMFLPMIVFETIYSVCLWLEIPVFLAHPQAVKTCFNITGNYTERKRQVVERFGGFINPASKLRQHDIADCYLMYLYWLSRQPNPAPTLPAHAPVKESPVKRRASRTRKRPDRFNC